MPLPPAGDGTAGPAGDRRWVGGLVVVLAVLGGGLWLASRSAPEDADGSRASNLRELPAFSLRGFDGRPVTETTLAGKPAVINFFASTCPFCIHEMPGFERVHARLQDRVFFLGVALRDNEDAARQLIRQTDVTYPLAFDDSGDFYRALRGFGMPVTVLVTPDGMIASIHSGPLGETQLERMIQEITPARR